MCGDCTPKGLKKRVTSGFVGINRVLAVLVAAERHDLGMGDEHVVALTEGLHQDLPVAFDFLDSVECLVALREREFLEVFDHLRRILVEGPGVLVEVDEDETVPRGDLRLGQTRRLRTVDELREVPRPGHVDEITLVVPLPPVERTHEGVDTTCVVCKAGAAVHACVVQGANFAILATDDDERFVGDVVDDVRPRLFELVLEAGELPGLHPDVLLLECREFGRRET